jgi:hypothetical protein
VCFLLGHHVTRVFRWARAHDKGLHALDAPKKDKRAGVRPAQHVHGPVASMPMPEKTAAEADKVIIAAYLLRSYCYSMPMILKTM